MTHTHRHSTGFTLLELMVTVTVVAILLGLAVPSFSDIIRNNRLTAAANDLLHSTHLARSEAIKRQATVVVCASGDSTAETPACNDGPFREWIVFVDTNSNFIVDALEPVVERHGALDASVTVRNDRNALVSYSSSGFATPAGVKSPSSRVVLCDLRGNANARALVIASTGRTRVTKDGGDISEAIGIAGGCAQ